jgi:hypothetical protein
MSISDFFGPHSVYDRFCRDYKSQHEILRRAAKKSFDEFKDSTKNGSKFDEMPIQSGGRAVYSTDTASDGNRLQTP